MIDPEGVETAGNAPWTGADWLLAMVPPFLDAPLPQSA
jgi:hypothetical protein